MRDFFRLLSFASPLGWRSFVYFLLVTGATIFGVFNLTAFIPLLQLIFDQKEIKLTAEPQWRMSLDFFVDSFDYYFGRLIALSGRLTALYYLCGLITISVFISNLFRYGSQVMLARVRIRTIKNLRNTAFQSILNKSLGFFSVSKKGDLISRVMGDVQEIEQSVVSSLKVILKDPLLLIGYFIALLTISAELTLYTLLLVPITGVVVSTIARRIKKWSTKSQQSLGRISSVLEESISALRIIKAFAMESRSQDRFANEVDQYARQTYQIAKKTNLAAPVSEVIGAVVLTLLLAIGGGMVLSTPRELGAAQFIGFLIIFSQTLIPAKSISVAITQINRGLAAGERVFELMEEDSPENLGDENKVRKSSVEQKIVFEGINFSYGDSPILKDVSFTVPKGKIVALVGASGSGKTTLADLLLGFYAPQAGSILIDGVDMKNMDLQHWRKAVGLVSQQPILFHDTVARNIGFGTGKVNLNDIVEAAKKAQAHDFIIKLPEGYETVVGDGGDKLSGGEKQRITIARAIVNKPSLLILDEATSSLDALSAEAVGRAFRTVVSERTTLIISHKRSTIELADEVLILSEGRILEHGSLTYLRDQSDLYRQLTE